MIRDFGNLDEVAPVLGITSDLAPARGASAITERPAGAVPRYLPVTLDEARGYVDAKQRIRFRVSSAVMLFVLSPSAVISLPTAAETGILPLSTDAAVFIGIHILLVLAAVGVALLVTTSREIGAFKRIAEDRFTVNPEVTRWAESLAAEHDRERIRALQVAIALWILAPIPLIASVLLLDDSAQGEFWTAFGVVLVLAIVATGLGILLPLTWAQSALEKLSRGTSGRGSATNAETDERSIVSVVAAFYWPTLTAIFLAWSLIGNAWSTSWVIWPIGAVLFGAIAAGGDAVENYRRARRQSAQVRQQRQ